MLTEACRANYPVMLLVSLRLSRHPSTSLPEPPDFISTRVNVMEASKVEGKQDPLLPHNYVHLRMT